ncbi:MAG: alpha/beta hydrolase [Acidobacteriota bacterium]
MRTKDKTASALRPRRRKLWRVLASVLVIIVIIWLGLALRSGFIGTSRSTRAGSTASSEVEEFSRKKKYLQIGDARVAYIDEGSGPPVILLHGCPFHSYEWKDIIPGLSRFYRVIAPDLLGLGDTEVSLDSDYRLPQDVEMVVSLMDSLGLREASFVGHDHGGATLQLLMGSHPQRITRAVLTNAEAYDQWPSEPERPYLKAIVNPALSPVFHLALSNAAVRRKVFGIAVHKKEVFTDEVLDAYVRAHTSDAARWQRLVRFFRWQLDPQHNRVTLEAVPGMRQFRRPTLLLWGEMDTNFGRKIAERLASDIPGTVGIVWLKESAHMPMQEEPEAYTAALLRFLSGEMDKQPQQQKED